MTDDRLAGKTLLVTRAAAQAAEILEAIRARGGRALLLPLIEIAPPCSWDACDAALDRIAGYEGILFASANGVEGFFHRLGARGVAPGALRHCTVYAVGQRTKDAIERHGLPVETIPERFTAADLLSAMRSTEVAGKTYLFPRGNLGSSLLADGLAARGAHVDSVEVYRTIEPDRSDTDDVLRTVRDGGVDAALFASPSAARHFAELFPGTDRALVGARILIAAIGPATAAALTDAGLAPGVTAPQSTMAAMLDAVTDILSRSSTTPT